MEIKKEPKDKGIMKGKERRRLVNPPAKKGGSEEVEEKEEEDADYLSYLGILPASITDKIRIEEGDDLILFDA